MVIKIDVLQLGLIITISVATLHHKYVRRQRKTDTVHHQIHVHHHPQTTYISSPARWILTASSVSELKNK